MVAPSCPAGRPERAPAGGEAAQSAGEIVVRLGPGGEPWNDGPSGISLPRALPQPSVKGKAFTAALRAATGSPPI